MEGNGKWKKKNKRLTVFFTIQTNLDLGDATRESRDFPGVQRQDVVGDGFGRLVLEVDI